MAFSLASFADRENRAWPGAPAAAARAGLRRSRYLRAREQLVRRGLIVVEDAATGRGRASTLALRFANDGPWYGARDQRRPVRGGARVQPRRAVPRGCSWRRWLRSPTRNASSRISRPSSCAALRGWPTGPTGVRVRRCLRQASWSCSAVSAGAETQTVGRSPTRGCSPARPTGPSVVVCHPRRARDR